MTKVAMPEPFMYGIMSSGGTPYFEEFCVSGRRGDLAAEVGGLNDQSEEGPYREVGLITTDQAEAYAAEKVREALEEAESMLTNMYTDAVKARVPEAEDEEGWNSHCLERALALQEAVLKIRTLTPA